MRPLTNKVPKPMIPVLDKPLLEHAFNALPSEIGEVILVVHYLKNKIKEYFGDNFLGKKIIYAEGSKRGTAYSFLAAKEYLVKEDRFLFLYGDECPNSQDVKECLKYQSSILCWKVNDPWNHGVVEFDKNNKIVKITEKPKNPKINIIAGGVMVLTSKIFDYKPVVGVKNEFYFTDMVAQYIKKEKVEAVVSKSAIGGISTPKDIERLEKYLKNNLINK